VLLYEDRRVLVVAHRTCPHRDGAIETVPASMRETGTESAPVLIDRHSEWARWCTRRARVEAKAREPSPGPPGYTRCTRAPEPDLVLDPAAAPAP
jgi:hypothetical protein